MKVSGKITLLKRKLYKYFWARYEDGKRVLF